MSLLQGRGILAGGCLPDPMAFKCENFKMLCQPKKKVWVKFDPWVTSL